MKRYFCCILWFCMAWNVHLFGNFGKDELRERIYVQTDKHLYLAGEPILMKLLTTNTEQIPLVFSKVAYVELIGDSVARLQIKVELTDGTGSGRILLPADLPTGYYRLFAYTQYMRNEGANVFFEKNIAVLNTFQSGYYPVEEEMAEEYHSPTETPLASRDNTEGGVSFQSDKATYTTRDCGELILNGLPEDMHTLSVSIAGKEIVPVAETDASLFRKNMTKKTTGFSNRFFPEYEGHIVTGKIIDNQIGNVIFEEILPATTDKMIIEEPQNDQFKILDSLLYALKRNTFDERIQKNIQNIIATVEQLKADEQKKFIENQINFEAVSDELRETSENNLWMVVPVLSFPGDGIRFFPGQKTETDDVRFFTSGISGMNEIATVVYSADDQYRVDIQSPFVTRYVPEPMPTLHIDSAFYGQLLARSVALQVFRYFSDDLSENQKISESYLKMKPSMSYPLDEYTRFTTMREVFIEFIVGARFRRNAGKQEMSVFVKRGNNYNYGTMPLVLLDGVPISNHDAIYNYDPLTVERINIYYGPCTLGGYIFDGIIELITYRRLHADLKLTKSSQITTYEGPQLPYRLNTPNYSEEKNRRSRMPDGRHTLLWKPDVRTDGKTSIRLPFDTSDLTGEFKATVEGITKDGQFIFATAMFKVEKK